MAATTVLVPVDLGPLSLELATFAARLAQGLGLRVLLFSAVTTPMDLAPEVPMVHAGWLSSRMQQEKLAAAREGLESLAAAMPAPGPLVTQEVVEAEPSQAILARASQPDVALIVMGTHARRGLGRLMLGSVAQRVLLHAPRPVAICGPGTLPFAEVGEHRAAS